MIQESSSIVSAPASAVIARAALAAAAKIASLVVEKRTTIPVLAGIHLSGHDGRLFLRGTDLDMTVEIDAGGTADDAFATVIPAHTLTKLAANSEGDLAAIDCGKETAKFDFGNSLRASMNTMPSEDFPVDTFAATCLGFEIGAADLLRMLDSVKEAISTEETRYYLNGIYVHVIGEALRFVATDGHRMSAAELPLVGIAAAGCLPTPKGASYPGIILPRSAVVVLCKLLAKRTDAVTILAGANDSGGTRYRFAFGGDMPITLTTKEVDRTFPDYSRVIPSGGDVAVVKADDLARCIKRVGSICNSKVAKLGVGDLQRMVVTMASPESGTASDQINAEWLPEAKDGVDGAGATYKSDVEIAFNRKYLERVLSEFTGREVAISIIDFGSPAVFREVGGAPLPLHVIMPMRF